MLFKKKSRRGLPVILRHSHEDEPAGQTSLYRIEFEMMQKGSVNYRSGVAVRQFGVYVNGVIRLVTSGDMVDRDTYEALVAAGAIPADPESATRTFGPPREKKKTPLVEDPGVDWE
ncbi:MAG: hypothetical protein IT364_17675 [Candidatus Hydrogenedentes bacterium]|nr:hypothetical protein [Candidatus Hydrogenedentota bacterium]